jgi:hypothetical protein
MHKIAQPEFLIPFILLMAVFVKWLQYYLQKRALRKNTMYRIIKKTTVYSSGEEETSFIIQNKNFTFIFPVWQTRLYNGDAELCFTKIEEAEAKIKELHKYVCQEIRTII